MLTFILTLGLLGADDRPEDDRFETENRAGLKRGEHAVPKKEDVAADDESNAGPKKRGVVADAKTKAIPANRVKEIAALKGQETVVEGTVIEVFVPQGDGLAIFNMGKDRRNRFTVIVRARNFEKFGGLDKLKSYKGKAIRVEGAVSIYRDLPQIEASVPSQVTVK